MAQYTVLDNQTGKRITFDWISDTPPNDTDLQGIFSEARGIEPATSAEQDIPQWAKDNPNLYGAYGAGKAGISQVLKPSLETAGFIAGTPFSPVGGPAVGFGIGKKLGEIIEGQYAKLEDPDIEFAGPVEEMKRSGIDVGSAAAFGKVFDIAGKSVFRAEKGVKQLSDIVKKGITKGIRPSVAGKRTLGQMERYYGNATDAVKSIIRNKQNLRLSNAPEAVIKSKGKLADTTDGTELPKSLKQFQQALDQTKKVIFNRYDALQRVAGERGAKVELQSTIDELQTIVDSNVVRDLNPGIAEHALKAIKKLRQRGSYTTTEAQEAVATLNSKLEPFYRNPTYENASMAHVDAMVANNLRKGLDTVIQKSTGEQYQTLKNAYGSLKTIERDLTRRAIVDDRRNIKGLLDFTDVFTGHQAVMGIVSLNPAQMGAAASAGTIKALMKRMNDPNRIIANMFKNAEKAMVKTKEGIQPIGKAFTGEGLPPIPPSTKPTAPPPSKGGPLAPIGKKTVIETPEQIATRERLEAGNLRRERAEQASLTEASEAPLAPIPPPSTPSGDITILGQIKKWGGISKKDPAFGKIERAPQKGVPPGMFREEGLTLDQIQSRFKEIGVHFDDASALNDAIQDAMYGKGGNVKLSEMFPEGADSFYESQLQEQEAAAAAEQEKVIGNIAEGFNSEAAQIAAENYAKELGLSKKEAELFFKKLKNGK